MPDFRFGCKRVLISDEYLRSLGKHNVTLTTDGIREITATGLIDHTGTHHQADVIIFGTGFQTSRLPLTDRTYGRDGRSLAAVWGTSPTAYLGTSVTGFPNLYLMHGPNIGLGHTSVIHMFESQANYIAGALATPATTTWPPSNRPPRRSRPSPMTSSVSVRAPYGLPAVAPAGI